MHSTHTNFHFSAISALTFPAGYFFRHTSYPKSALSFTSIVAHTHTHRHVYTHKHSFYLCTYMDMQYAHSSPCAPCITHCSPWSFATTEPLSKLSRGTMCVHACTFVCVAGLEGVIQFYLKQDFSLSAQQNKNNRTEKNSTQFCCHGLHGGRGRVSYSEFRVVFDYRPHRSLTTR